MVWDADGEKPWGLPAYEICFYNRRRAHGKGGPACARRGTLVARDAGGEEAIPAASIRDLFVQQDKGTWAGRACIMREGHIEGTKRQTWRVRRVGWVGGECSGVITTRALHIVLGSWPQCIQCDSSVDNCCVFRCSLSPAHRLCPPKPLTLSASPYMLTS